MSASSCTPVVVDGWGGAGDGCEAVAGALGAVTYVQETLRACVPEQWQSTAADEFTARVSDLLGHCDRLVALVEDAHRRAVELAAAVQTARQE